MVTNPTSMKAQMAPAPAKSQAGLIKLLLVVFIIGFHTRLSIASGGSVIVPMYLCVFSGAALFLMALQRGLKRLLAPLLSVFGLIIVTAFFASLFGGDIVALLRGAAQLSISIALATGIAVMLADESVRTDDRFFLVLWGVFLALGCIELIPGARPIFNQVSELIYSGTGRGLYASLDRDLQLYGQYRAKAFASEPSFLAATLAALNLLVLFTGRNKGRRHPVGRFLLMLAVAYLVAPSLSALFYLIAALVFVYWPRTAGMKFAAVTSLMLLSGLLALAPHSFDFFSAHQRSGSFFGRITAGPIVGTRAMIERPLLGYGVGDAQAVLPTISNVWSDKGAYSAFPWYASVGPTDLMSNGFWWQWIYFGIVGGALFILALLGLLRAMNIARPLSVLVSMWVVWYAGAAFVDLVSWSVFAVFAAAAIPVPSVRGTDSRYPRAKPTLG
ncbi:hypothetical protein [Caulobacter sp. CCH9-E1]|uniref:hypothetical protein n=1 Tax=Caulobacter sp. CCH9-E1 TaxID=1768768 RepID=UPI0008343EFA|nr:hypothetical protein [Caulobacter sp. CCH9-E1]